jgi:hypothetical protein
LISLDSYERIQGNPRKSKGQKAALFAVKGSELRKTKRNGPGRYHGPSCEQEKNQIESVK